MAKSLRIEYVRAVYHVTSRDNAGKPVFRDEEDRENMLTCSNKKGDRKKREKKVQEAVERHGTPAYIIL